MRKQKLFIHELLFHVRIGILFCSLVVKSVISADPSYVACKPRNCGSGPNISFPFYVDGAGADFCGLKGFRITCQESTPIFRTPRGPYIVANISYENQSVRLVDLDVVNASCVAPKHYFIFDDGSPFEFSSSHVNIQFFYNCNKSFTPTFETSLVPCASNSSKHSSVALVPNDEDLGKNRDASDSYEYCESEVSVPVDLEGYWKSNTTIKTVNYTELLMAGFSLVWYGDACANCKTSGGRCGFQNNQSLCFCPDGPHPTHCGGKSPCILLSIISILIHVL
ncbi:Wall-associated receptor kinase, C-terminal [Trema orientale]|uniref:non-specific serine/threonine protein kinase n=1 Tax=Trema orientale TaxID=63057 RepID=A0A2P5EN84_TREOI|nr:Wall-associated receptor kinase, C-terminal [Trema orientale]